MKIDLLNQVLLRWDSDSDCAAVVKTGGIDVVWLRGSDERIARACRAAGAEVLPAGAVRLVALDETGQVPPGALKLGLIDAWAAGGNYILAPEAALRDALLAGNHAAMAAWSQTGWTAGWLKAQQSLFRQPPPSTITVLVEPDKTIAEIGALMFRQSASPDLVSAGRVPASACHPEFRERT